MRPLFMPLLVLSSVAGAAEDGAPVPDRAASAAVEPAKVGETAPPIVAVNPDGNAVLGSHLKGKVVLLAFWTLDSEKGTGMPLETLRGPRSEFRADERFLILTVCVPDDETDGTDDWIDFVHRRGKVDYGDGAISFQNDPRQWNAFQMDADEPTTAQRYGVADLPAYFLIGDDGRLVAARIPPADVPETVRGLLRPAGVTSRHKVIRPHPGG